jgi:hypothetical protein
LTIYLSYETSGTIEIYDVRIGAILERENSSAGNQTNVETIANLNKSTFESKLGPKYEIITNSTFVFQAHNDTSAKNESGE